MVCQIGGSGDETQELVEESDEAIVAVLPTASATQTPIPITLTATITPEPTETPTATPDLKVPPPDPALGSVWDRPQDKMQMVYVPPGTFPMGSEEESDEEKPVHDVALDGFWIDQYEISNDQFAEFVSKTGYMTTAEEIGSG